MQRNPTLQQEIPTNENVFLMHTSQDSELAVQNASMNLRDFYTKLKTYSYINESWRKVTVVTRTG